MRKTKLRIPQTRHPKCENSSIWEYLNVWIAKRSMQFHDNFFGTACESFGTIGSWLRTSLNISVGQFNFQHGRQNTQIDFELAQERTQNGDKPFSCSHSLTSGNVKRNERVHIHTIEKQFSCSQCNFKCSTSSHLKWRERTHTGDKPFRCSQCDYKCSTSSPLKTHERIHTGDKPFSCSQCDFKCSTSSNLKQHEITHTGNKPYSSSSPGSFLKEIKTEPNCWNILDILKLHWDMLFILIKFAFWNNLIHFNNWVQSWFL